MAYRFVCNDLGESWEIEDNDFLFHPEMWYQSVANYVAWYRDRYPEMRNDSVNSVYCYHDDHYFGVIGVGDNLLQWVIHEPVEKYYRVERVRE